jgi:5-methylcytosine-specific restriction protein B
VHSYFDLKTKDFIDHKEEFNNSLENIIQHFHGEFTNSIKLNKQSMKQQSINRILFGPPGTGKTYSTINHALSIIENKELVDLKNEKREIIRKRFENYVDEGLIKFTTFHQSYTYEDFVEGIRPQVKEVSSGDNGEMKKEVSYDVLPGVFKTLVQEAIKEENESKKYVLIIDEINRGNISDIFGELITLFEFTKRAKGDEEVKLELPYSKESFKVPSNIYTIGTMNTADRSISLIDTALRRRFDFIELPPSLSVIEENVGNKGVVDGVDLVKLLETINNRIEFLLDKDHLIGHSYFLSINSIEDLKEVFKNNILPLLEEYFHNDYFNIQRVLGDNPEWEKSKELKIISSNDEIDKAIFGGQIDGFEDNQIFKVREDFNNKDLFIAIYKK